MLSSLFKELKLTMLEACEMSLKQHADEDFYCVALFTSGEYRYLVDSIATTQGLERVAKKYLAETKYRDEWGTVAVAMRELKWSPCDSPYHCEFAKKFSQVQAILASIWDDVNQGSNGKYLRVIREIHETCIATMCEIRDSRIFNNERVTFNVLMGDQSNEDRLLNAELLNSHDAVAQLRREVPIEDGLLEYLRQTRFR